MLRIDALELLTAQHAQIDDLFDMVDMLRDPDALDELANTLALHMHAENELVYPRLSPLPPADILAELNAEHCEIRRILAELIWMGVKDPDFDAKLRELGVLLDGHELYEEQELLVTATSTVTDDELVDLHVFMVEGAA